MGDGSGTHHLQGYLEATHSIRLPQLKNWQPTAHFEIRRGTRKQALKYVTKQDTRVTNTSPTVIGIGEEEFGRLINSSNGTKTNSEILTEIQTKIQEGATDEQIADEYFEVWVKYHVAISKYRVLKTTQRNWQCETIIIWGPTGTGKSRYALEHYPGAYWKQRSQWWDGYMDHDTIIIDEFYGWIPYDLLLRLCDRYPLLLEVKGGQVQCTAKTIIITSNNAIHTWYRNIINIDALKRRITKVIHMPHKGIISNYTNINSVPWGS